MSVAQERTTLRGTIHGEIESPSVCREMCALQSHTFGSDRPAKRIESGAEARTLSLLCKCENTIRSH